MSTITDFETLDAAIKKAGGQPKVLEALWDGDTEGWSLCLSLYTETQISLIKTQEEHFLGPIVLSIDQRLNCGAVWTEAIFSKELAAQAVEKYGLTFYFPSPNHPDLDCPSWTEQHRAIRCADCNKLIIPNRSPYLPQDICYNCHIEREHKRI